MKTCAYCDSKILLGGKVENGRKYCNVRCLANGRVLRSTEEIPPATVASLVQQIHNGECPKCKGRGPVEVFHSFRVWSAVLMTKWETRVHVSCRRCATKAQLGDLAYSFFLGWWGIPHGVIMTPVQIVRNVKAMAKTPDPLRPSAALERVARLRLAVRNT